MAISSENLDGLLNVTFPIGDNEALTVESFTSSGTNPNATLPSLTADVAPGAGPSGAAGGSVTIVGVNDSDNSISEEIYDAEGYDLGTYTEYVLGFADDSILVSGNDANDVATDLDYNPQIDDTDLGILSAAPLAEGSSVAFTASGSTTVLPCFAAGTLITGVKGAIPVERLSVGDMLLTLGGGACAVRWVGHRRSSDALLVRLVAGSLGCGTPTRDLLVSDDHGMFVDDAIVPAGLLVNGTTIKNERRSATLYHVELEAHAILLAEDAPAESYLDTGNRAQFSNCPLSYDATVPGGECCAEVVLGGPRLARIRVALEPEVV